jgi:hypothetical protein
MLFEQAKVAQSVVDSIENATLACSNRVFCASARILPGQMLPSPCGQTACHLSTHHPPPTRTTSTDI